MEEYKSKAFHFRDFLDSVVWYDIKREMQEMRESVRDDLENLDEERDFYRAQGRAEVLRDLQLLPQVTLEALEEYENREQQEGEE